jgi:hypothetical protein
MTWSFPLQSAVAVLSAAAALRIWKGALVTMPFTIDENR